VAQGGRQRPPGGTAYRGGLQNEEQFKNRSVTAQIKTVDEDNGRIKVEVDGFHDSPLLQIPLQGFSINRLNSSWVRYMPQENEHVKLNFNQDGSVESVGYCAFGEEAEDTKEETKTGGGRPEPRQSGYARARKLADANTDGLGTIFRKLYRGEWDMRSKGGADIYGNRHGTLSLAGGGGASIRLIKKKQETRMRTDLLVTENSGVDMRMGRIKRQLVPGASETEFSTPGPGAVGAREWTVDVGFPTPAVTLPLYTQKHGDVRDGLGVPEFNSIFQPLRSSQNWYDPTGLINTLSVTVDSQGNVEVSQGELAAVGGISVTGGGVSGARLTSLSTDFLTTTIDSTLDCTTDALINNTVKAGVLATVDAPLVQLGGAAAINPVIKGIPFLASEAAYYGGLTPALVALNATVAPLIAALLGPPPATSFSQISAPFTAWITAWQTFLPIWQGLVAAQTAGIATWPSTGVFTV